jgi:hypothetical protein
MTYHDGMDAGKAGPYLDETPVLVRPYVRLLQHQHAVRTSEMSFQDGAPASADRPAAVEVASGRAEGGGITPHPGVDHGAVPSVPPPPTDLPGAALENLPAAPTTFQRSPARGSAGSADSADPAGSARLDGPARSIRAIGVWVGGLMDVLNDDFDFRGRRQLQLGVAVLVTVAASLVSFVLTRPVSAPQVAAAAAREMPVVTESAQPGSADDPTTSPGTDAGQPGGVDSGHPVGTDDGHSPGIGGGTGRKAAVAGGSAGGTGGGNIGGGGMSSGAAAAPTTGSQPSTTAPAVSVRLSTLGGVIVAVCAGGKVSVLDVVPVLGSQVVTVERGARDAARVEFNLAGVRLRLAVRCVAGVPIAAPV